MDPATLFTAPRLERESYQLQAKDVTDGVTRRLETLAEKMAERLTGVAREVLLLLEHPP